MKGFLLDLHCHTKEGSYDGEIPVRDLLTGLAARGFSGVVLTDHSHVWPEGELGDLAAELQLPEPFVLLSGQEVRTSHEGIVLGDLLVYGVTDDIPDGLSPVDLFKIVKASGGFAIAAHPAVPRIGFGPHAGSFPVVAMEGWNGRYGRKAAYQAQRLAQQHGLPLTGGSDAHRPREIGTGGTLFSRLPRTLAEIAKAIAEGEVRPWRPLGPPFRFQSLFSGK